MDNKKLLEQIGELMDEKIDKLQENLVKKIDESQEDTINVLSELMNDLHGGHEKRIKRIEKHLQLPPVE